MERWGWWVEGLKAILEDREKIWKGRSKQLLGEEHLGKIGKPKYREAYWRLMTVNLPRYLKEENRQDDQIGNKDQQSRYWWDKIYILQYRDRAKPPDAAIVWMTRGRGMIIGGSPDVRH